MSKRLVVGVLVGLVALGVAGLFAVFGLGIGDQTAQQVVDRVFDEEPDDREAAVTTTTLAPRPEPSPRPELPVVESGSVRFFCDFTEPCALDQFVQYRDAFIVAATEGQSDHAIAPTATFDDPVCTAPEETRPWQRAAPYDLVYRCLPGGNVDAAHQMSVVPDTSGYSFTSSSPDLVFDEVERISFRVNMTSAGERNFWEVAVIPADDAWVDGMPCIPDLPCNDNYDYDDIGAVGFGNFNQEGSGFLIATPDVPDGHWFSFVDQEELADGSIRFAECTGDDVCFNAHVHGGQIDVRTRYAVVIEERDDGVWFGQEDADGTFHWAVLEGEHLPEGPVRVVLKFHGYTPTKSDRGPGYDGNLSASVNGFTWHWDDFEVIAGSAVESAEYYGDLNPERFTTASAPRCLAFAQGQRDQNNRNVLPVTSCPADLATSGIDAVFGPIAALEGVG